MAYSELIKNFEAIRNYMREFYVYGFKTREEIGTKSARSYDNERRRIESWLGDYMSFHMDTNGKAQFLSVDTRTINHNPLYKAFKAKSFTDKDIILHFYLLDLLLEEEWLSFRTIVEELYREYFNRFGTSIEMDETTIRNKLKEYVKFGIIEQQKNGKNYEYRLAADDINLSTWKEAIGFYSEINPLGVIGSFLQDKTEMSSETFAFKHQYMLYALDSEIMYTLLNAISKHCTVEVNVKGRKSVEECTFLVLPMSIYVSTQGGREYLLAFNYHSRIFRFFRLDNLTKVTIKEESKDWERLLPFYHRFKKNMWGTSTYSCSRDRSLEHLEMDVHIDEGEEFIIQRLERERRNGTVEKIDDNTYRYQVNTRDTTELLPWIRTYICRIVRLTSTNPNVERQFKEDLEEMYKMYGIGDTDDI